MIPKASNARREMGSLTVWGGCRALAVQEGLDLAARLRGGACYVVEVCTACNWNHLSEAFRDRSAG